MFFCFQKDILLLSRHLDVPKEVRYMCPVVLAYLIPDHIFGMGKRGFINGDTVRIDFDISAGDRLFKKKLDFLQTHARPVF